MKNVFLFPGQGAQKRGMLADVCQDFPQAKKLITLAEEISGEPVSKFLWETEDAELARSDRSQLAITTTSLVLNNILESNQIVSDVCAGFSLGEFSALCASGVLSFEDTIKLVTARGKIMQQVCDKIALESNGNQPGMAAVIGLPPEKILSLIEPLSSKNLAFAANLNSPKQTVIAGTTKGLEQAEELFTSVGCRRFIKLKVAGPFHSPLMKEAAEIFSEKLSEVQFNNPSKKLFSNVTGTEIKNGEELKKLLFEHFTNPVRWTNEEAEIAKIIKAEEPECKDNWKILEVGPGTVLSGLWRDSGYSQNISCQSINSSETIKSIF